MDNFIVVRYSLWSEVTFTCFEVCSESVSLSITTRRIGLPCLKRHVQRCRFVQDNA
jgi:hypothetical protein